MRINQYNIFECTSSRVALLNYLELRQECEPSFSVRRWSKDMGMSSHSLLNLQLQGKRKVSLQHVERFTNSMGLTEVESRYLQGITLLEKANSQKEKQIHLLSLNKMIPKTHLKTKKYNQFSILSDWIHMAIMALTEVTGIKLTEKEINQRLAHQASKAEITAAIIRLLDEGLLTQKDTYFEATYQSVTTTNDISDSGIKEYHRQASDLAKKAVDEVELAKRELQSFCLAVPDDKILLAKDLIRKFREDFYNAVGGSGENIYKMNVQFFQLSRCPEELSGVRECAAKDQTTNERSFQ